jgi:hypothetical protein
MGLFRFLFGFGKDDDDEGQEWEEVDTDLVLDGEWAESDVENDLSSEEGTEYNDEFETTADGKNHDAFDPKYAGVEETLQQPKKLGGLFDWLFWN